MKKTLLFILFPIVSFTQTKIGENINGKYPVSSNFASFFGTRLSFSNDGSVLAIGDTANWPGTVWVFKNVTENWTQYGSKFSNGGSADEKGKSISLSGNGNIIAVGSPQGAGNGSETGFAQVYENINGIWTQVGANIKGKLSGEYSGSSVSLSNDGNIIAIGARGNSQNNFQEGCVRVYKNIAGTWTKIGTDLNGKGSADGFGSKVMLSNDGETMAIGTANKYISVYKFINGNWILLGNQITGNNFNFSFSGDGTTLVAAYTVTEYVDLYTKTVSYVKMMKLINNEWQQVGASIRQIADFDKLGTGLSLSSDGTILAVGSPGIDEKRDESGTVRLYKQTANNWSQLGVEIKGEAQYDENGAGVLLSADGNKLAIGSPYNDNITGINAGCIRVFNLSPLLHTDSFVMSNFTVFPNPTSDVITITLNENLMLEKVNIYNVMGQLIKTEKRNVININSFSKGTYYFEIITDKGKATKAVIVK